MTTEEHIKRIIRRCQYNLALTANRSLGEWRRCVAETRPVTYYIKAEEGHVVGHHIMPHDARYIEACAADAEAGWRTTIRSLRFITGELAHGWDGETEPDHPFGPQLREQLQHILELWPAHLL